MDKEFIIGLTGQNIKGSGLVTRCLAKVFLNGQMDGSLQVNLRTGSCMDMVFTLGRMAEGTKANTSRTRNRDLVYIHTPMAVSIKESGLTVFNKGLAV